MSGEDENKKLLTSGPLVVRSAVPKKERYQDYRQELRADFFYSCAYCTLFEAEAGGISYHIDHYIPQVSDPQLENEYSNLMYACQCCNTSKNDIKPPKNAVAKGVRFWRPDQDDLREHYEPNGLLLRSLSPTGEFTIRYLSLNRHHLRRVREIRRRFHEAREYISAGVLGLRQVRIDQLPKEMRQPIYATAQRLGDTAESLVDAVDHQLRSHAKSEMLEPDPDADDVADRRRKFFAETKAMFPGPWRGRETKAKP